MSRNVTCFVFAALIVAAVSLAQAQSIAESELPSAPASAPVKPVVEGDHPSVQIAILLDNSGSMSGLIEQAKSELWRVVNELTTARQKGKQPRLQVALYTYGNPPPKQLNPLTDDLDKVSESLFAVKINGGSEYCGQVIQAATQQLAWSAKSNDLKLIFIAGNEPFTQGPIDYKMACKEAIEKGIMVNTIHCGNGIPAGWRDGALLADGKAMSINQNTQVVHIDAPQDVEITRLGVELNRTYIPFGTMAAENQLRQSTQDMNAASQSLGSSIQRAVSKANAYYRNDSWDLADAVNNGSVELSKVKVEALPDNMKKMTPKERKQHIEKQTSDRKRLQKQINELNARRNRFVTEERKKMADKAGHQTLDQALISAIRTQANAKQFKFDAPKP
jgi:hypothetical protein